MEVRAYIICIWAQFIVSLNNHNSNIMIADYRFPGGSDVEESACNTEDPGFKRRDRREGAVLCLVASDSL